MDRNVRYSRRGGFPASAGMNAYPHSHSSGKQNSNPNENCLCDGQPISLAMAYVKPQPFGEVYSACDGWKKGTIFPALDMPYCMGGRRR